MTFLLSVMFAVLCSRYLLYSLLTTASVNNIYFLTNDFKKHSKRKRVLLSVVFSAAEVEVTSVYFLDPVTFTTNKLL